MTLMKLVMVANADPGHHNCTYHKHILRAVHNNQTACIQQRIHRPDWQSGRKVLQPRKLPSTASQLMPVLACVRAIDLGHLSQTSSLGANENKYRTCLLGPRPPSSSHGNVIHLYLVISFENGYSCYGNSYLHRMPVRTNNAARKTAQ